MTYHCYEKFMNDRNKLIYEKKRQGATCRELGEEFGISANQVSVICRKMQKILDGELTVLTHRKIRDISDVIFEHYYDDAPDKILIRAINCTFRYGSFGHEYLNDWDGFKKVIGSMAEDDFLMVHNCGKKTAEFLLRVKEDVINGKLDQMQREDAGEGRDVSSAANGDD